MFSVVLVIKGTFEKSFFFCWQSFKFSWNNIYKIHPRAFNLILFKTKYAQKLFKKEWTWWNLFISSVEGGSKLISGSARSLKMAHFWRFNVARNLISHPIIIKLAKLLDTLWPLESPYWGHRAQYWTQLSFVVCYKHHGVSGMWNSKQTNIFSVSFEDLKSCLACFWQTVIDLLK